MILTDYGKTHIPMKFTWEMTEKCNLNCVMCYSINCSSSKNVLNELSTKDALKLFDILEKNEVLYLFLDGGEPLLREDFLDLLQVATSKFCTWVSTNGTLINNTIAKELKKSNVGTVFVSLHGHSEKIHDRITQTPKAFNATIRGIESLMNHKVPTMTSFQISRINAGHIESYIKMCKELGIPKINFLRPYLLGNGQDNYKEFALDSKEYEEVVKEIDKKCNEYDILYGHSFDERNHNCCKQAFSCDSRGYLMNCPYLRFLPRLGNVFEKELISIWNSDAAQEIRNSYKELSVECLDCKNVEFCCGGCTASRLIENGNLKNRDPICYL